VCFVGELESGFEICVLGFELPIPSPASATIRVICG